MSNEVFEVRSRTFFREIIREEMFARANICRENLITRQLSAGYLLKKLFIGDM